MLKRNKPALHHILCLMEKNAAVCSRCTSHWIHPNSPLLLPSVGRSFSSFQNMNLLTVWRSSIQKTPVFCINNVSVIMLFTFLLQVHVLYTHSIKIHINFYIYIFFRPSKRIITEAVYCKCWVNNVLFKTSEMESDNMKWCSKIPCSRSFIRLQPLDGAVAAFPCWRDGTAAVTLSVFPNLFIQHLH